MNVLVDTSIWIDHLRRSHAGLRSLLEDDVVVTHAFVLGELVLGGLSDSTRTDLERLRRVEDVSHDEAMHFVETNNIAGSGAGWVDIHLLAASVVGGCLLWTKDRALAKAAQRVQVAYQP